VSCSITNPVDCVTSAAKSVAGDVFSQIAHDFGEAAASTINWLWGQLSQASAVQLSGKGFELDLGIVAAITGVIAVALFVIQLIASVLRRDAGGLGRAFRGLVVAFVGGGAAVGVTNLVLAAVDSLSAGVVQVAMGTTIDQMGHKLLSGAALTTISNPAGQFLLAIAAIAAAVIVWVALVIRKVLIVVSAVFAPLAFAGSLADITVSWTRKWLEVMVALIFSKLILVIIFVVGWGMLDAGVGQSGNSNSQTVTQTAAGLLVLAVAGFAPWMALKLVHFGEDQFHRLHVLGTTATHGARTAAAAPQKAAALKATAASMGAKAVAGSAGAAAGGAAARPGSRSGGSNGPSASNGSGRPGSPAPSAAPQPAGEQSSNRSSQPTTPKNANGSGPSPMTAPAPPPAERNDHGSK
jgi:hypothetical protein